MTVLDPDAPCLIDAGLTRYREDCKRCGLTRTGSATYRYQMCGAAPAKTPAQLDERDERATQ